VLLPVLEAVRALSAASGLLDAAVAAYLHLHGTDLRCLDYLARFGPVFARRLARAVGLSSEALTIAVDRLEQAALSDAAPIRATGGVSSWN
jgi:DNA-binding MarR family transcriptional regulator